MIVELLFAGLIRFVFVYKIDVPEAIALAAIDESRAAAGELRKMGDEMR